MSWDLDAVFIIDESPDEAFAMASQKLDASRATGDARGTALGLIKVGEALALMGRVDEAQGQAYEAMGMCNEIKFEEGRAAAMNVMTQVMLKRGRDEEELEEALDSASDTLKLFQKLAYRKGEAVAQATMSSVYKGMSRSAPAIKCAKEALAIFAELGEQRSMAQMYHACMGGYLVKSPPDTARAAKQLQKALAIYEELGDKSKQAACMHAAATVEVTAASYKKAAEYLAKSQALYIEAGDFHGRAKAMESLMDLYLEADMYVEAVRVAKERVTVFHDGGDMQGEGKALLRLGGILLDHGDFARAKTMAELAVNVFVGIGDYDSINGAKAIMDGAEKAKTIEDINTALVWANDYTHVPITLVVEPGLTKKIADDFAGLAH